MRNAFSKYRKVFRTLMLKVVLLSLLSTITVTGFPTGTATAYTMAANDIPKKYGIFVQISRAEYQFLL